MEEWKDIEGYEGLYAISNKGRVYSYKSHRILKGSIESNGYIQVHLTKEGYKNKKVCIHRLVGKHFLDNNTEYDVINHKNGIKTDNRVENLEYCSPQENTQHAVDNSLLTFETIEKPVYAKFNDSNLIRFKSIQECADYFKVSHSTISRKLRGVRDNPAKSGSLKDILFYFE